MLQRHCYCSSFPAVAAVKTTLPQKKKQSRVKRPEEEEEKTIMCVSCAGVPSQNTTQYPHISSQPGALSRFARHPLSVSNGDLLHQEGFSTFPPPLTPLGLMHFSIYSLTSIQTIHSHQQGTKHTHTRYVDVEIPHSNIILVGLKCIRKENM